MKFKSAVLGVALLAFGAGAANAGSWWMGGNAGLGFPTGNYGDAAATGWNLGLTATNMVNDQWGIGADLGYHSWGASDALKTSLEATMGAGSDFTWTAMQATGHAMYRFPTNSNVKPYAKVGMGLYNIGGKLTSPLGDVSSSNGELGFNFGAGMHFASKGNSMWGVNGTYHVIHVSNTYASDVDAFSLGVDMLWGGRK
jgi:hypothetical protein